MEIYAENEENRITVSFFKEYYGGIFQTSIVSSIVNSRLTKHKSDNKNPSIKASIKTG